MLEAIRGGKYWGSERSSPREWDLGQTQARASQVAPGEADRAKLDTEEVMNKDLRSSVETDLAGAGSPEVCEQSGKETYSY